MKKQLSKGFTLIELLIVVAIIAILAAIAVPNFLEAQTRAKVSRAQADMRTFATGIEAYFVDNNQYPSFEIPPFHNQPCSGAGGLSATIGASATGATDPNTGDPVCGVSSRLIWITTPIAYLSSVLPEAFNVKSVALSAVGGDEQAYDTYDYVRARDFTLEGYLGPLNPVLNVGGGRTSGAQWRLASAGPDTRQAFGGAEIGNTSGSNEDGADYDSSNGTISSGDIVRVGGGRAELLELPFYYRVGNTLQSINNDPPIN